VFASARLYIVPGRPAWHTPLTVVAFAATGLACGPLLTGRPVLAAGGAALAVAALAANVLRLRRDHRRSWWGTARLYTGWFRGWTQARVALAGAGAALAFAGASAIGFPLVLASELIGRWLFYVTVVPLNVPGSFWRGDRS
jgi:formate dehydrogenase iron-sulfur subunit